MAPRARNRSLAPLALALALMLAAAHPRAAHAAPPPPTAPPPPEPAGTCASAGGGPTCDGGLELPGAGGRESPVVDEWLPRSICGGAGPELAAPRVCHRMLMAEQTDCGDLSEARPLREGQGRRDGPAAAPAGLRPGIAAAPGRWGPRAGAPRCPPVADPWPPPTPTPPAPQECDTWAGDGLCDE
jgi:hypothetical protein